jgi:hypothetical protein
MEVPRFSTVGLLVLGSGVINVLGRELGDSAGNWNIRVRELSSGVAGETSVQVE